MNSCLPSAVTVSLCSVPSGVRCVFQRAVREVGDLLPIEFGTSSCSRGVNRQVQRFRLERYFSIAVVLNLYLPGLVAEVADLNRSPDRNGPVSDRLAFTRHRGIGRIGGNRDVVPPAFPHSSSTCRAGEKRDKREAVTGSRLRPRFPALHQTTCPPGAPAQATYPDLLRQDPELTNESVEVVFRSRRRFCCLRRCGSLVD